MPSNYYFLVVLGYKIIFIYFKYTNKYNRESVIDVKNKNKSFYIQNYKDHVFIYNMFYIYFILKKKECLISCVKNAVDGHV